MECSTRPAVSVRHQPVRGDAKKKRRASPEIETIFKSGQKTSNEVLALYWKFGGSGKAGASHQKTSKPFLIVGKQALRFAHERNRAKRVLRELYQQHANDRKESCRMAIRVIKRPERLTTSCLKSYLEPLLKKAFA
jgi:ribonuclease P protein component